MLPVRSANIELSISLLDQRLLAGDRTLYDGLKPKLAKYFETQRVALIRHLANLTQERHAKAQNTIFHLEPNVKENPGGIRDLHVIHWLGRLQGTQEDTRPATRGRAPLLVQRALPPALQIRPGREHPDLRSAGGVCGSA